MWRRVFGRWHSVATPVVLASVALLALVLLALGVLRYLSLRQALLAQTADNLALTYTTLGSEITLPLEPEANFILDAPQLAFDLSTPSVGVLTISTDGVVRGMAAARGAGGTYPPKLPRADYLAALQGRGRLYYVAQGQVAVLEQAGQRVFGTPEVVGLVELATPVTTVDAILGAEIRFDLLGGLVALLAAALAASLMIRSQLEPLEQITAASERVAAGDLEQRVNLTDRADEIGRLGRSFDEMVSHLSEAFARERAAQERLVDFLADASHALRTPLTVLTGHLDLLLRGADEPEQRHAAYRRLRSETERMARLVSGLLALTRLEAAPPPTPLPVDLAAWLVALGPDLEVLAGDRLTVVAGPGRALADANSLRDVVLSLVDNAVRYAGPEAPIRVEGGMRDGRPFLEVADGGPGLDPAETERVFERFVRGREGKARVGAGLGLNLARRTLAGMGASIEAGRAPEGGARFTLWLAPAPATRT